MPGIVKPCEKLPFIQRSLKMSQRWLSRMILSKIPALLIPRATLVRLNLIPPTGYALSDLNPSGVEFFRCDLTNTNFQKALLRNANFRDARVDGAKFTGADMGIAILRETDLRNADLSGVDLATTLMPAGFAAKKQGA